MGWHCFTSLKDETCFCQWTDANLSQQQTSVVGLGFSAAGLIGVRGRPTPDSDSRHSYVCPPCPLHLLSASFIPEGHAHTGNKRVHEICSCCMHWWLLYFVLEGFPCLKRCSAWCTVLLLCLHELFLLVPHHRAMCWQVEHMLSTACLLWVNHILGHQFKAHNVLF